MERPEIVIEGQVFEPIKRGFLREVIAGISLAVCADKIGWSIPDPLKFKTAVAGMELETFYGKEAEKAFNEVVRQKPFWEWVCDDGPMRRKVLLHNP